MPVIYDKNGLFGARITEIISSFHITVSTAKEGFFEGLSTIIAEGAGLRGRPCCKIIYVPHVGKSDRQQFHDLIVTALDEKGMEGYDLFAALQSVKQFLDERGVINEFINLAQYLNFPLLTNVKASIRSPLFFSSPHPCPLPKEREPRNARHVAGSKLDRAWELGVLVLTEEEFLAMVEA